MMKDIPRDVLIRTVALWCAIAATIAALASVRPESRRYLKFAAGANDRREVAVDAVAPAFGSLALGVATQGPYTLVGSQGDATPIAVDGAGRVFCVPPEAK